MRLLGVDMGDRRVGLATSDPSAVLATPLRTLSVRGSVVRIARTVASVVITLTREDDGLAAVVVGRPCRLDGQPHRQTTRVLEFARALRAEIDLPVYLQDERLTSQEADQRLAHTEKDWRRRKARLDAAAAAIILQDYLDEHPAGPAASASSPEPPPTS